MDYFDIIDDKSFCNMEEYKLFMEKFKPKVTTDECYTPKAIYNAVSDYVAEHYNLDNKNFVRPFYPGGNYQKENYRSGDVVVDNPPFSILAEILKFYNSHNIKFFLFADTRTVLQHYNKCCCVVVGASVIYNNKATVNTSFLTNLEDLGTRSEPKLYRALEIANCEQKTKLPKYEFPEQLLNFSLLQQCSKYGVDFEVPRESGLWIRHLDHMKEFKKEIYGGGVLLSDKKSKELYDKLLKAKERYTTDICATPSRWELSDNERALIATLK